MKLKEAEARAEFAEKTVKKLQKEVDRLEGKLLIFFFFLHSSVTSSLNITIQILKFQINFEARFINMRMDLFFLKKKYSLFCYRRIFSECFCNEFKRVSDVIWQNDNNTFIIRCSLPKLNIKDS